MVLTCKHLPKTRNRLYSKRRQPAPISTSCQYSIWMGSPLFCFYTSNSCTGVLQHFNMLWKKLQENSGIIKWIMGLHPRGRMNLSSHHHQSPKHHPSNFSLQRCAAFWPPPVSSIPLTQMMWKVASFPLPERSASQQFLLMSLAFAEAAPDLKANNTMFAESFNPLGFLLAEITWEPSDDTPFKTLKNHVFIQGNSDTFVGCWCYFITMWYKEGVKLNKVEKLG